MEGGVNNVIDGLGAFLDIAVRLNHLGRNDGWNCTCVVARVLEQTVIYPLTGRSPVINVPFLTWGPGDTLGT
jgi:hypothetical protein